MWTRSGIKTICCRNLIGSIVFSFLSNHHNPKRLDLSRLGRPRPPVNVVVLFVSVWKGGRYPGPSVLSSASSSLRNEGRRVPHLRIRSQSVETCLHRQKSGSSLGVCFPRTSKNPGPYFLFPLPSPNSYL